MYGPSSLNGPEICRPGQPGTFASSLSLKYVSGQQGQASIRGGAMGVIAPPPKKNPV